MRKILLIVAMLIFVSGFTQNIITKFEQSKGKQSPTYFEIIDWWQKLDQQSGKIKNVDDGFY